jgi:predicted amidohydrolase YtcJ
VTSPNTYADLILLNGDIRTQDPANPRSQSVAIAAGRILAVGDNDPVAGLAGDQTRRLDLNGRLVLPGFMDAHFHYYDWALGRLSLNLADLKSMTELVNVVRSAAAQKAPGEWILGLGFNESEWPRKRLPTRRDLDAAAADHPVFLLRCDLHLAVANSMALAKAGIDIDTPDPPEGVISRDSSGRPNGVLRELAVNLVKNILPEHRQEDILRAMAAGIPVLHSMGITGIQDIRLMGGIEGATAFRCWQLLKESGDLALRCWVSIAGEQLDEAVALGLRTGFGDDHLRIGHVKYFADGGMGARTAWMIEPYLDAECGLPLISMETLRNAVLKADRAGLAVAVHAIGDRTNRELIRIFEDLESDRAQYRSSAAPAIAHRIEHVQMIRTEDVPRLAKLKLLACVQPHNLVLDMNMIDECVGSRGKYTYAFRDLLDAGIQMCLSSDAPVCDPSPLVNIHAAVTRCRPNGTPAGGWYPRQKISVEEAVRGYTLMPAIAGGAGDRLGSITAGKHADMIVLDRNLYTIDPMEIIHTQVDMTILNGRIVYQRPRI